MDQGRAVPQTAAIKPIRTGDAWDFSLRGFLAGGFRVLPFSGEAAFAARPGEQPAAFTLARTMHLSGTGYPLSHREAFYLRQESDRSLLECGTESDGPVLGGAAPYLPGTLAVDYRRERHVAYANGARERGWVAVTTARRIATPAGELHGFKVRDAFVRTEPGSGGTRVDTTGWLAPQLGFFVRGTIAARTYDPHGRFRLLQLYGFQLTQTSVTP